MNQEKHRSSARWASATAALAALILTSTPTHAAPVWNVNIGNEITTSDNFAGAAPENTVPNSFWNSVLTATPTNQALSDSTGASSTATLTLTPPAGKTMGYAGFAPVTGLELFSTWMKTDGNDTPFTMTIGGLNSSATSPAATSSSSITMTATTASDASGVEYFFDETSGNLGGGDSGWQNSPTYIDTGLSASTTY